jgi:hypothetical protein
MGETFSLCKRFVDIEIIPAAGRDSSFYLCSICWAQCLGRRDPIDSLLPFTCTSIGWWFCGLR